MKSLADVEKEAITLTKRQKKLEKIKKILGRDKELPEKLKNDDVLSCGITNPVEVLRKGGYINIKRGWIRRISRTKRYHAYPFIDEQFNATQPIPYYYIYIHKDITQNGKHKATKDVLDEKIRLKEFISPRINTGQRNIFLPREERIRLLEQLKENKPQRKTLLTNLKEFWYKLRV